MRAFFWNADLYLEDLGIRVRDGIENMRRGLERMGLRDERTVVEKRSPRRVRNDRAPPWSWASIEGVIGHRDWALGLIPVIRIRKAGG
jgi:hypothetical protein